MRGLPSPTSCLQPWRGTTVPAPELVLPSIAGLLWTCAACPCPQNRSQQEHVAPLQTQGVGTDLTCDSLSLMALAKDIISSSSPHSISAEKHISFQCATITTYKRRIWGVQGWGVRLSKIVLILYCYVCNLQFSGLHKSPDQQPETIAHCFRSQSRWDFWHLTSEPLQWIVVYYSKNKTIFWRCSK